MAELKKKAQKKEAKEAKVGLKANKKVVTASVVGGVIGSVTTLLFAPKSGKELRDDISSQVTNAKDKTVEFSGNTRTKLSDFKSNATERSKHLTRKFKREDNEDADESESELYSDVLEDAQGSEKEVAASVESDEKTKKDQSENRKPASSSKSPAKKPATKKKPVASNKAPSGKSTVDSESKDSKKGAAAK
ncbi:YtxH domain-containing protein [Virgibacillus necropolis]|uniref:YtxH domain-containing protein n=1 Tax=Virgibacillus necropolis TaxID=163877 RepID=UPI00384CF436